MLDKEQALKSALEAGINILKENFGDDYDRAIVTENIPLLVEAMWPYIDSYHERRIVHSFDERFHDRFPNHVLVSYGPTVFDYVVGNVQTATVNEVLAVMEKWLATVRDAQKIHKFQAHGLKRDWDVAQAHIEELISEVKQYRARGGRGNPQTHTGSHPTQEKNNG